MTLTIMHNNQVLERASALGSFFLNAALHDSDNKRETRGKFGLLVNRSAAFDRVWCLKKLKEGGLGAAG